MSSFENQTDVLIGGKIFTLSGFESEEYLQKVSSYLNRKIEECTDSENYRKQDADTRSITLALNVTDDYFKAIGRALGLERDNENKEKEMYNLKHQLVSAQVKLEQAEKNLERLKRENNQLEIQIAKLETEIENRD